MSLIKEKPERAVWWIQEESWAKSITKNSNSNGIKFRPQEASYAEMFRYAQQQMDMLSETTEPVSCFCGD